ncbi:hypothetical protein N9L68_00385 [bacterium]|nr:hypothetical protein [bacterium]
MWKEAPLVLKVRMAHQFEPYLNHGMDERPDSWSHLLLSSLPKDPRATSLDQHRRIALMPVLGKWYMRSLLILHCRAQPNMPPRVVQSSGYQRGRSIASVVFAVRECFWDSRVWVRPLVCLQLYESVFEHPEHAIMMRGLEVRNWDARLRLAHARELTTFSGEATIRDALPTPHFAINKSGRTGGAETQWLILETFEAYLGPSFEDRSRSQIGFE